MSQSCSFNSTYMAKWARQAAAGRPMNSDCSGIVKQTSRWPLCSWVKLAETGKLLIQNNNQVSALPKDRYGNQTPCIKSDDTVLSGDKGKSHFNV
ncbi:hypothetical protein L3Q82_020849 [Scortum barcoo]|uniref:Uncharacterized protein n=1 Tax=Scortum barcoo TaxID=214431 RepID=A0ACB8V940_9TELE|nr:hypothetical protein L3Q82_020849 [Scortum barcoo]